MSKTFTTWISCIPPKSTHQSGKTILRRSDGTPFLGRNAKGRALKQQWKAILFHHRPESPFQGPLELSIKYALPWRKTDKLRDNGWKWCDQKPDADNLAKQLQDTMGDLEFFQDDKDISRLTVEKIWSDEPGVEITLKELPQNASHGEF